MSKNESLKRGNKMTVEEYKKNRKARLQQLSEALDNLPELTDGKAHIEVDAVTGSAKAESEDRAKQVKDALKDKNKETREFIKKQDKDREVEKEDKSENRLMLDESLFNEEVDWRDDFPHYNTSNGNVDNLIYQYIQDQIVNVAVYEDDVRGYLEGQGLDPDYIKEVWNSKIAAILKEASIEIGNHYIMNSYSPLANESLNKKSGNSLTEAFSSSATDVIDDLVDRAKSELDENESWSVERAIQQAIDDGLVYRDDILTLAKHYGVLNYDQMLDAFYEDLYSDMATQLAGYDGTGMVLSPEDEI